MFTSPCIASLLSSTVVLKMTDNSCSQYGTLLLISERAKQALFSKNCVSLSDLGVAWRTDTGCWSLFSLSRTSSWQKSGYTDDSSQKHWSKRKSWIGICIFWELGHWKFLCIWRDLESHVHTHSRNHVQKWPWEDLKLSSLPDL